MSSLFFTFSFCIGAIGDDPQAVVAIAFAGLCRVNGVGGQDAGAVMRGEVIHGHIVGIDTAPVPSCMTIKALQQPFSRHSLQSAWRGDNRAQTESFVFDLRHSSAPSGLR